MWQKLYRITDEHLIRPFRDSHAPLHELSLGAAIGMFWALTPLIGAQMTLVAFTWVFFKSIKINFNLPIALPMVWITNPLTMPFFYYTFYIFGFYTYNVIGFDIPQIGFGIFREVIRQNQHMNMIDGTIHWVRFMIDDLGLPMLIGSIVLGIPSAIVTYPISAYLIKNHRINEAHRHNQSYEQWEAHLAVKHAETVNSDIFSVFRRNTEKNFPLRKKDNKKTLHSRRKQKDIRNG
jgi:uncharacterized protein